MAINLAGFLYSDNGTAVQSADVTLIDSGGSSEATTTTNSSGYWSFAEADEDIYDIQITSGSQVRRIKGLDKITLSEIDVRNSAAAGTGAFTFTNTTNSTSNRVGTFRGLNSTRADNDEIYLGFNLLNDAGEDTEFARMTVKAIDVSNGSEDGQIEFSIITGGSEETVMLINSTTAGVSDMTLDVTGDLVLDADGGDVFFKDGGTTFGSASNNSGNLIIKSGTTTALTFTGSSVAIAGDLTISGDDLVMATNTSGHVLVADGTNYNPVAVSGDITMASNGAVTIASTAVETGMIAADAITGAKIADDAIGSEHIADDAITSALIADDAITSALIADDAITTALIADDAITSALIADGAVTTALIGADAVTNAKIADDAINSEHYTDGSIDTAHIADNNVTLAKIADVARGSIIYGNASAATAELTKGSANTVLKSDGTDISWGSITVLGTIATGVWQGTAIADAYVADALTISGGTIDNSVIGGSTAAAISATTISASDDITLAADKSLNLSQGANITFTDQILDNSIDDHDAQGIIFTFRAGATVTPFSPVYVDGNNEVQECDADAIATMPCIGVSVNTSNVSADADCPVLMLGLVRDDSFTDFGAAGAPVYVSTTVGTMTTTAPSGTDDVVQVIGHSIAEDLIFVQPCLTTIEHA